MYQVKYKIEKGTEMKIKKSMSVGVITYIVLFAISLLFILLYIALDKCNSFQCYALNYGKKLIEVMATGLFPALFLAFLTDIATTIRQKKKYAEYYNSLTKTLKEMCESLPTELHASVIEVAGSDMYDKRATFEEWCNILYEKEDKKEINYFVNQITDIKNEAIKLLEHTNSYQSFIDETDRKAKVKKLKKLISACNGFYSVVKSYNENVLKFRFAPEELSKAIMALFPIDLSENKYIKIGYSDKFNSDDYCE